MRSSVSRKPKQEPDFIPQVRSRFARPDGTLRLSTSFGTALFIGWMKHFGDDEYCRKKLMRMYEYLCDMRMDKAPPGNHEHNSDHNVHNTYIVGAAT